MLQRVETEVGHFRGFGVAKDAAHAAVIVKTIVLNFDQAIHSAFRRTLAVRSRSRAPLQAPARVGTSALTTVCPFNSMRNSPRVTRPTSTTATSYCAAIRRTAATFSGVTDTTARAPRSPKSAASSASWLVTEARTESPSLAKHDSASVTARPPS